MIIRDLIDFKPESKGTDISGALKYFTNVIKKRSTAFIISDFVDSNFEDALKIANKKHDMVALHLYDIAEQELPDLGLVPLLDAETNEIKWVNTSDKKVRIDYKANALRRKDELSNTFRKSGVDVAEIATDHNYVKPLMNLFKRREH